VLIHHFLERSAAEFPEKVALVHEEVRATYREINAKANQLADWLMRQGITPGDRVVLLLENSLEYVIGYYGGLKAGAGIAPVSTDIKSNGLRYLLGELEAKVIISSGKFEDMLLESAPPHLGLPLVLLKNPKHGGTEQGIFSWDDLVDEGVFSNPGLNIDPASLGSIIFTSGSTGRPKGVVLAHENIAANVHSICQYLHLTEKDIQMAVLPFYYVMGKSLLNTHFAVGGRVVINNKFTFPVAVLKQMAEEKVTGFSGVPSTYAYLLHRSPLAAYRDKLPNLRYCSQAGGHMSRQVKEELRKALPVHTDIYIMYGATEASARLAYLEPARFKEKIDSIGKAIPGVHLKILDEKGMEVPVGQIGELVASGANIMKGYWRDVEATDKVLDKHGYHTGDLCYQDEEGFFYLVGRKDNLLKVGGHRVSPREIEDVIMGTGVVSEVAVLGIPDAILGTRLVALITPKSSRCSAEEILALCVEKLPKHQIPTEIKLLAALPKKANGKLDFDKCEDHFKLSPK